MVIIAYLRVHMSFFQSDRKPFLISGPCSAESEEQVFTVARALRELPVHVFRAGVWKPRTRPGGFEGHGEPALEWLRKMHLEFGIPVAIEVAETSHVELAVRYGIHAVWIGARTTVNPFQVQRLADALRGTELPVMVKNPVNPDIGLWLGAIERLEQQGIRDIAAIHRGFSSYRSAPYRNQPNWAIPVELRRRRNDLPMICDPSHISGHSRLVSDIAQKAMDMLFDGLMIEVHPDPATALSDAAQQLTPEMLQSLIENLVVRKQYSSQPGHPADPLEELRQIMDSIDAEIIDLLARRMDLSDRIGQVKKDFNMTAYQPDRWQEIVETRSQLAAGQGLPEQYILQLYEMIHQESIKKQLEILKA